MNLKRIRLAKGLTQQKVAVDAELHYNYLSSVERGERNISIGNMERIAAALEVPIAALLDPIAEPALDLDEVADTTSGAPTA